MKIKTSELIDQTLDWAVHQAWCEGACHDEPHPAYSTDWTQGGPIIEREIFKWFRNVGCAFTAQIKRRVPYYSPTYGADIGMDEIVSGYGPTPLIAAMRCYVASKLGDEVEVPDVLG